MLRLSSSLTLTAMAWSPPRSCGRSLRRQLVTTTTTTTTIITIITITTITTTTITTIITNIIITIDIANKTVLYQQIKDSRWPSLFNQYLGWRSYVWGRSCCSHPQGDDDDDYDDYHWGDNAMNRMAIFSLILIFRKLKVKLIKVKTAKFVRRGQHLYLPCCTPVFPFYTLTWWQRWSGRIPHILHRTFIYGDRIEQLMVLIKIPPLMNAMARMTFSPMRRQFVDVHTGDGCASLVSDFPHVKLLLFGTFLMFLMAK